MNIAKYESMCAAAGMQPVLRGEAEGLDFFIADGFSAKPWIDYQRFGGTREEFPGGAYATLWLLAMGEEKVIGGGMCLFDTFHDPGFDRHTKKQMRVATARQAAESYLEHVRNVNARSN